MVFSQLGPKILYHHGTDGSMERHEMVIRAGRLFGPSYGLLERSTQAHTGGSAPGALPNFRIAMPS